MLSQTIFLLAVLSAEEVYSSIYNSPRVHLFTPHHKTDISSRGSLFTPTHQSSSSYQGSQDGVQRDLKYQRPTAHVLQDRNIANSHALSVANVDHTPAVGNGEHRGHSGRGDIRFHGHSAVSHLLPNGHIAESHRAVATKAEPLSTVGKATNRGRYSEEHRGDSVLGDSRYHGPIADTHKVTTAAKPEHLPVAGQAAVHRGRYLKEHHGHSTPGDIRYQRPAAPELQDGHFSDTHAEVAIAGKAEHLATVGKAAVHSERYSEEHRGQSGSGNMRYQRPTTIPYVLHNGHIADTPEVAAAKAERLNAVRKVAAPSGGYFEEHRGNSVHGDIRYQRPTAFPHILHDGHIADPYRAVTATAEHSAYLAGAPTDTGSNHGVHQIGYFGTHHGYAPHTTYHGPIAIPHVLHNGYLADTEEVAAAKLHHLQALRAAAHRYPHQYYYL